MLLMGKSTMSMAIFKLVYQGVNPITPPFSYGFPMFLLWFRYVNVYQAG